MISEVKENVLNHESNQQSVVWGPLGPTCSPLVRILDHWSYTVYSVSTTGHFQKNETGPCFFVQAVI